MRLSTLNIDQTSYIFHQFITSLRIYELLKSPVIYRKNFPQPRKDSTPSQEHPVCPICMYRMLNLSGFIKDIRKVWCRLIQTLSLTIERAIYFYSLLWAILDNVDDVWKLIWGLSDYKSISSWIDVFISVCRWVACLHWRLISLFDGVPNKNDTHTNHL